MRLKELKQQLLLRESDRTLTKLVAVITAVKLKGHRFWCPLLIYFKAPEVGFEPTTLRLTAALEAVQFDDN